MTKKDKLLRSAEKHLVSGKLSQAIEDYRRLLELEPNDPSLVNTIGDLLIGEGRTREALENFRKVAGIYRDRGFALKAIAMLRKILRLEPEDLESRETLAGLFQKQGLQYEAARELRVLASHHEASEDIDQLMLCLKRLTQAEPSEADLWARLARLLAKRGRAQEALDHYLKAIRLCEAQQEVERVFELAYEALGVDNHHRDILHSYVSAAESLERLTPAEEFLREQIELTGDEFPFHMFLAWIAEKRGDMDGAGRLYSSLQTQGHQDPLIGDGLIRTGWIEDDISAALLDSQFPGQATSADERTSFSEMGFGGASEFDRPFSWDTSSGETEDENSSGLLFEEEPGLDSSGIFRVQTEVPMSGPETEEDEVFSEVSDSLELTDEGVSSLEEALEEVDFYLKLGFQDDARQLLKRLLEEFPGDERIVRRAGKVMSPSEIPAVEGVVPPDTEQEAERLVNFESELESALEDLFAGGGSPAVEEVLRYDVTAHQGNGNQNSEVHYDLGLAYKEMGLVEDALREFLKANDLARKDQHIPQQVLCSSMLASSYYDVGDYDESVRWAETGLELPDTKEFEWKALKYDLALALEKKNNFQRAAEVYREILQHDPGYRDVNTRMKAVEKQLGNAQ